MRELDESAGYNIYLTESVTGLCSLTDETLEHEIYNICKPTSLANYGQAPKQLNNSLFVFLFTGLIILHP